MNEIKKMDRNDRNLDRKINGEEGKKGREMTERDRNVNKWTGKDKCGQRNETMMDWNNRNVDREIKKGQEKDEKRKDRDG